MRVDALLQHKVEGQVNRMVEKVRGLEIEQEMVEVVTGVAKVAKEMVEMAKKVIRVQTRGREAVVSMTWEDFKTLTREELCLNNEMQKLEIKFWCHVMVEDGYAIHTDRLHKLARLVPHLVTPENKSVERYIYGLSSQIRAIVAATEPTTIRSVVLKNRMLTNETIRNGALKKITKKRWNNGEPSRDGNVSDDNKRSRTGRAFATITTLLGRITLVRHPNAQTVTITINPRYLVICVQIATDSGTLPRIVGWGLG
uniref:Reverse transcriptase domain-containing protein n=1 Tax=Tanacetum cinerariifolium TaxID=118510 RepID=A0A6L2NAN5_TANCI|nr:reverse transcriptase domain-containing protein [Tanacetum cinerariifolium]